MTQIALIADFDPHSETHRATEDAIKHSAEALGVSLRADWIKTTDASLENLKDFNGLWIGTGSPYKDLDNVLNAITYARQTDIPLFATCGGFQHVILEIARNELKLSEAAHAEYEPEAERLIIVPLPCSLRGREMKIELKVGSNAARFYGRTEVIEHYYCSFGVNPAYLQQIKDSSLEGVGSDGEGELRIVEISKHRFFVGTLFVPQVQSRSGRPHPLVNAFVKAVTGNQ